MTHFFPHLEPVCCSLSSCNCCFLACMQVSQEAGQIFKKKIDRGLPWWLSGRESLRQGKRRGFDPTRSRAGRPGHPNNWAWALELGAATVSPRVTATEAGASRSPRSVTRSRHNKKPEPQPAAPLASTRESLSGNKAQHGQKQANKKY